MTLEAKLAPALGPASFCFPAGEDRDENRGAPIAQRTDAPDSRTAPGCGDRATGARVTVAGAVVLLATVAAAAAFVIALIAAVARLLARYV